MQALTTKRYLYKEGKELTEEIRQNLAMINGERGLFHSDPAYTNICMSRKDLRTKMANLVVDYVEKHKQHNQVAIYLADNNHNHFPENMKRALRRILYFHRHNRIGETNGTPLPLQKLTFPNSRNGKPSSPVPALLMSITIGYINTGIPVCCL